MEFLLVIEELPDPLEVLPANLPPVLDPREDDRLGVELVVLREVGVLRFVDVQDPPLQPSIRKLRSKILMNRPGGEVLDLDAGEATCRRVEVRDDESPFAGGCRL